MPQFILKITLGNDAMQTGNDIAIALRNVAGILYDRDIIKHIEPSKIMDFNGNAVGSWQVK